MQDLFKNIDLSSKLLNAIWLRKPIIVSCGDNDKANQHINNLLNFIPDYRLLITCGKIPKSILYQKSRMKILDFDDKQFITQNLFSAFEEENVSTPPLQLICFDADDWIFVDILNKIDKGWIASTSLHKDQITFLLDSRISFFYEYDSATFFFLNNSSTNSVFEKGLIKTVNNKPQSIINLVLQKKMSEVRYVGQALIKELEQGNTICQTEIEEIYNIDNASFHQSIAVLKSETRFDISKYTNFTPPAISAILNRIINLNGVSIALCQNDHKILGLVRKDRSNFNDLQLFSSVFVFLSQIEMEYDFGNKITLNFEFDTNTQLLFLKIPHILDFKNIGFAFILEPSVNNVLFLYEVENIFKEV